MSKNWIKKAIDPKRKGALHRALNIPLDEKIPLDKLESASEQGGKLGKMANEAKTLGGFHH